MILQGTNTSSGKNIVQCCGRISFLPQTHSRCPGCAGANAQWVGRSNRLAAFNSRACSSGDSQDDLCAVVVDVQSKRRLRVLPRPIFNISPDGTVAASLDFIRLGRTRQGTPR